jgi:hypothetical protein
MNSRKFTPLGFACCLLLGIFTPPLRATLYPLEIFTDNGSFKDSPALKLNVEISDGSAGQVDFTFFNESLIDSCIAAIYFDDGFLLGTPAITDGPGTSFGQPAKPSNLPGGRMLDPPFVATGAFGIDSNPPPPKNGINCGEWVRITFDLKNNATFENLIDRIDAGVLRIGAHIIALPDGSSKSAVNNVPEPTTICLLGLGSLSLFRRKRSGQ